MKQQLEAILAEFKAPCAVRSIREGPVVTTYLVEPGAGVRVRKVVSLEDDIALRLGADSVRIVGNLPGEPYMGVEIPRPTPDLVGFVPWPSRLTLPMFLGLDTIGRRVMVDLARAPHLLVAGATGSGKSVAVHTMICTVLKRRGNQVKFLLIDPKQLEFVAYANLPQLLVPVVTDAIAATDVLNRLCVAMDGRYTVLARAGARKIAEFNRASPTKMPYVVVVIDEWADLYAMQKDAIVNPVVRLAQKARAAGIHLILATQRPSVKVLPGLIKANFPARIALKVTNGTDSRVILDQNGAERLIGRGDMLVNGFQFGSPTRVHGAYVDPYKLLNNC